jgi:hypothetical protein
MRPSWLRQAPGRDLTLFPYVSLPLPRRPVQDHERPEHGGCYHPRGHIHVPFVRSVVRKHCHRHRRDNPTRPHYGSGAHRPILRRHDSVPVVSPRPEQVRFQWAPTTPPGGSWCWLALTGPAAGVPPMQTREHHPIARYEPLQRVLQGHPRHSKHGAVQGLHAAHVRYQPAELQVSNCK